MQSGSPRRLISTECGLLGVFDSGPRFVRTLIGACSQDASRSPSVAAATIALREEIGITEAFENMSRRRDSRDPHPAIVHQAVRVHRLILSVDE